MRFSFGARDAQDRGVWKLSSVGERSSSAFWVVWRRYGERRAGPVLWMMRRQGLTTFHHGLGIFFLAFLKQQSVAPSHDGGGVSLKIRKNWRGGRRWGGGGGRDMGEGGVVGCAVPGDRKTGISFSELGRVTMA